VKSTSEAVNSGVLAFLLFWGLTVSACLALIQTLRCWNEETLK